MSPSFWLVISGITMNLVGTVFLIFSVPAAATTSRIVVSPECVIEHPDENTLKAELKFVGSLFRNHVIKENSLIRWSFVLLVAGVLLQIYGLYLDC